MVELSLVFRLKLSASLTRPLGKNKMKDDDLVEFRWKHLVTKLNLMNSFKPNLTTKIILDAIESISKKEEIKVKSILETGCGCGVIGISILKANSFYEFLI